uniref:Uncharacterized protein n=1 Tax=Moniliophthora roreri TaxID=221103 RepID=A0A0W0G1N1_MONRR
MALWSRVRLTEVAT